jgi:nitroreductase
MGWQMDYEGFMDLVRQRRSYWHFRPDPVSEELVAKVIDAARYAPSGYNSQPWEFVVVREQTLKDEIARMVAETFPAPSPQPPQAAGEKATPRSVKDPVGFKTAPVFILVLADTRVRGFGSPGVRADDGRWQTLITTTLAIAYEHMHLAATSLGLVTRWASAVADPPVARGIRALLGLPDYLMVYEMMGLGHSDFEPLPKKIRPLAEVMHFDACGERDFRTAEQIAEYFAGR